MEPWTGGKPRSSAHIRKMQRKIYLPYIGQRIVKTAIAVFLCLVFYYYRGYRGAAMSAEAAITAIICMQPYVHDTRESAYNRLSGSAHSGVFCSCCSCRCSRLSRASLCMR